MMELVLFVTSGCHLCEQAQQVVYRALGVTATEVEIATDTGLLERYGVRIPVLQRTDNGAEIDWPFAAETVQHLIEGPLPADGG